MVSETGAGLRRTLVEALEAIGLRAALPIVGLAFFADVSDRFDWATFHCFFAG